MMCYTVGMTGRTLRLAIRTDDGVVLHREIPYVDPELEPAPPVSDPAQDATHRARVRLVVAVPGIGLVVDPLDEPS